MLIRYVDIFCVTSNKTVFDNIFRILSGIKSKLFFGIRFYGLPSLLEKLYFVSWLFSHCLHLCNLNVTIILRILKYDGLLCANRFNG